MIYFDQLIEIIDERIEKTDDYNDRINNEYNIKYLLCKDVPFTI